MESGSRDDDLVDRIYECGFNPDLWPTVLRDASKMSGSAGASLFVTTPEVVAWTASGNARDITDKFVSDGWYWRGSLMSRIHKAKHPGFLRDVDICSHAELSEEPIYRDSWCQATRQTGLSRVCGAAGRRVTGPHGS